VIPRQCTVALEEYKFECKDIWKMDETGVTTIQRPSKAIAVYVTSAERETLVTVVLLLTLLRTHFLFFVFSQERYPRITSEFAAHQDVCEPPAEVAG
jgi:hypothetical protein